VAAHAAAIQSCAVLIARTIADLTLADRDNVMRKARLHMDATRSSALFAERLALVEGVSDAALLREFAWAWAGTDGDRQSFVDALSIVAIGNRIGAWPVQLLATRDAELCSKLALLADSDKDPGTAPTAPAWLTDHNETVVQIFFSEPTLEPAVTPGNEVLVEAEGDPPHLGVIEGLAVGHVLGGRAGAPQLGEPWAGRVQVRDERAQLGLLRVAPQDRVQVGDGLALEPLVLLPVADEPVRHAGEVAPQDVAFAACEGREVAEQRGGPLALQAVQEARHTALGEQDAAGQVAAPQASPRRPPQEAQDLVVGDRELVLGEKVGVALAGDRRVRQVARHAPCTGRHLG
jgi:hypothetical protein